MENFNSDPKLHQSQYLTPDDRLYFCGQQSKKNKWNCYYYVPVYYLSLHPNDYLGILNLCKSVEGFFVKACIAGVSGQAINENIDEPKIVEEICMSLQADLRATCISGMVSMYINHFGSIDSAGKLCEGFKLENRNTCYPTVKNKSLQFLPRE